MCTPGAAKLTEEAFVKEYISFFVSILISFENLIVPRRSSNTKTTEGTEFSTTKPTMSTRSFARERRGAVWGIEDLRLLHKPDNFDDWVCLGGDYRDQAEVQEFATKSEREGLRRDYEDYQRSEPKIHEAPPADAWEFFIQQQLLESAKIKEAMPQPEEAHPTIKCYWCEDTEGVTLVKSYQLYGCRECASECGSDD
jgi:hypothetical protein